MSSALNTNSEVQKLEAEVRELERLLGSKLVEIERLKMQLQNSQLQQKWVEDALILPNWSLLHSIENENLN